MGDTRIQPSPAARTVTAYSPPPFAGRVTLKLDANECAPPGAGVEEVLGEVRPEDLSRYPDARGLEAALAAWLEVDPGRVVVTAGADDAIERIMRAVLWPGRNAVVPVPTFEMIGRYARMTGGEIRPVEWMEGPLPVDRMLERIDAGTGAVCVVTPNSPTGLAATAEDLRRLSRAAPTALLVVDLAYTEFAGEDLTGAVLELENGLAIRTMSKAWGLAGLRVGYAAGPQEVVGWMRSLGHPYAVSSLSLEVAGALLERRGEVDERVSGTRRRRDELAGLLADLGMGCGPSEGNFLLAATRRAGEIREELAARGVAVRSFPGDPLLEDRLRITIPTSDGDMALLAGALREASRACGAEGGDAG